VTLARERYRAGEDDLIVLLEAQSAYTAAEQHSIAARAATLSAQASLYKSPGWRLGIRRLAAPSSSRGVRQ